MHLSQGLAYRKSFLLKKDTGRATPILAGPSSQASMDSYYHHEMVRANERELGYNVCSRSF